MALAANGCLKALCSTSSPGLPVAGGGMILTGSYPEGPERAEAVIWLTELASLSSARHIGLSRARRQRARGRCSGKEGPPCRGHVRHPPNVPNGNTCV
jgi:hypothetical protein